MDAKKIEEVIEKKGLFRPVYIPGIDRGEAAQVLQYLGFKYIEERLDRKENILLCDIDDLGIGDGSETGAILVFMSTITHIEGGRKIEVKIHKSSTPDFDPATTKLNEVATLSLYIARKEDKGKTKTTARAYFGMLGSDLVEIPIPAAFAESGEEVEEESKEETEIQTEEVKEEEA